ncbi:NADH-cytochrome b5 reductase-like isoform X1 [Tachyglossus aculeatus]|uniref:NADH-cytochrome b5 reductase-like isoform X1 n=1 Tax=Tachyglossus aculeatus TaxID=9261 RepID=UPI0018F695AF|nr:NADH-cytochrome b5 reductase-like isoform X1 [Tachyglossus aculeatus]
MEEGEAQEEEETEAETEAEKKAAGEEEDQEEEEWLRLRPVEPRSAQCCGSGCRPCIFDLYQRELARWEEARARKDKGLLSGNCGEREREPAASVLSPDTFQPFSLSAVDQLTDDTFRFRFTLPANGLLGLSPGQHIVLRAEVDGQAVQRAYTPVSPVDARGYFDVLIKCYRTGLASRFVRSWRVGDSALWRGPFGGFPYRPNQFGQLLLLAAGTGLAPMLPILHGITDDADDETFVTLVGCFRTFGDIYLKSVLQDLARFWNVQVLFVLSQESSLDGLPQSYRDRTHLGRLDRDRMVQVVDGCRRKPFALVCGPPDFQRDVAGLLQAAGLTEESFFLF